MSIKIFGKKFFKSSIEKEREKLRMMDIIIAEKFEACMSCGQENAYTDRLQERQKKVRKRLDEIGWN